ncbi:glycine cleavage system protein R [Sandaracinus amylolyticus]|uniref:Formyltetrahydrofolate hydrolase n=1 Tax=Sandaracinus amylolyticus TaxID=927083 RepID=A0A0F6W8B4_9BACT|nr:ACT domain-containing protein [Sandaracinus amylolyticus]AKF09973.1 Formyltetrahydrofolate hydrolase [Sandaracinus amylolyticus]
MTHHVRISIACRDDRGLLAAVAGRLFELGGDLGDASFGLLGEQAELVCVCAMPDHQSPEAIQKALAALPALKSGEVTVKPFDLGRAPTATGRATHVVRVRGNDRPGLMARLCEAFGELGANIVRMDAQQLERSTGTDYLIRFEAWIPAESEEACLANVANTAESMAMSCDAERVAPK